MRYLLDIPSGTVIWDAANMTMHRRASDPNCDGFVFNGLIIRVNSTSTVQSLMVDYELAYNWRQQHQKGR